MISSDDRVLEVAVGQALPPAGPEPTGPRRVDVIAPACYPAWRERLFPAIFAIGDTPRQIVGQVRPGAKSWTLAIERELPWGFSAHEGRAP